jgi:hypothetical protein
MRAKGDATLPASRRRRLLGRGGGGDSQANEFSLDAGGEGLGRQMGMEMDLEHPQRLGKAGHVQA